MPWPILIASFFPIIVYLTIGLRARTKSVDDYFVYGQQVSARDYANTSVGYAFQMVAIFLFADWGARYGLGALWTVLFWFFGFALLYFLLPRFLDFHSQRASTLHQYLTSRFRAGHTFQRVAALATIVGLWGTMMSEVDYTTQVYDPVFPAPWMKLLLGALLLSFGVVYTVVNGYKAEVNTERFQVPIAFGALLLVLIFMLPAVWVTSGVKTFMAVSILLLAVIAALIYGKSQTGMRKDPQTLVPMIALLALFSVATWTYLTKSPGSLATVISQPITWQLRAQGFFGLLSLFIANVFWMPVDLSTWQRISSVEGSGSTLLDNLRRGTRRVLFESPASWILGVVLGLAIQGSGLLQPAHDPSEGIGLFSRALSSGSLPGLTRTVQLTLYPLLIMASLSIMFSTVNGLASAISFTAYRDLPGKDRPTRLGKARLWTLAIILVGLLIYPFLRFGLGANLPTFLYSAYSAQLSLFVVAMLALRGVQRESRAALCSLVGGLLATVIAFVAALKASDPSVAVLPPLFAVLGAWVGYMIGFRRRFVITDSNNDPTKE